jgi:NAD(P)-dependent dehydrogenase (short-subunit alcohol dehydrogenase family)
MSIDRLFSLDGKVAIVTGASRGIGFAIGDGLAQAGAHVVAMARSARPDHSFAAARVEYRCVDVEEDLATHFAAVARSYGGLDVLVNAAGISMPAEGGHDDAGSSFDRTLRVNLSAAYASCIAARPHMRAGGSIINVTSIGSVVGFPGNPGYVASKGGLRMMTKALAVDYGPSRIRVNALAPGYIETKMTAKSFADPEAYEQRRRHTCLGRWGAVADLVGAAIFLASDASSYMTGQDLIVDGGWTAKGLV